MFQKIDHIGVAVKSLDEALKFYAAMGLTPNHFEEVASQKVKVAFLQVGDTNIELLEPTSEDSPIAKFMEKKGEGIHHIAYAVEDVNAALQQAKDSGVQLINETPMTGAHGKQVAFVHPKSTNGVLTEFCADAH